MKFRNNKRAGITQLEEYHVANVAVVGSSPILRSISRRGDGIGRHNGLKVIGEL